MRALSVLPWVVEKVLGMGYEHRFTGNKDIEIIDL